MPKKLKKNSIIFINPDYHCSFIYRDKLEELGWKASVYVNHRYPKDLLYSTENIYYFPISEKFFIGKLIQKIADILFFIYINFKYKFHFYYSNLDGFSLLEKTLGLEKIFGMGFRISLLFSKLCGVKIIYVPSGCNDILTKKEFSKIDQGNICNNCGSICNDNFNTNKMAVVKRYSDLNVCDGSYFSNDYKIKPIKYKSLRLDMWKPHLKIPKKFLLPKTDNIRILHSFYNKDREIDDKNIKGSPHILDAIERLKNEGYKLEYIYINKTKSKDMRFLQSQADICIDQLIYGWIGSTAIETGSLGKPVIVYLNEDWKKNFFNCFPQYKSLPYIEANIFNVYEVLKNLLENKDLIKHYGKKSREFSLAHHDINKNGPDFEKMLLSLK